MEESIFRDVTHVSYVLIALGIALAYLAYQGEASILGAGVVLKQELFTNADPYYKWAGAFIIVGLIGYVPELQPFATAMLILIVLAIALSKAGAVVNLEKAL